MLGAAALLSLSFLVFLAPVIWGTAVRYIPELAPFGYLITFVRLGIAACLLILALLIVHLWLPG